MFSQRWENLTGWISRHRWDLFWVLALLCVGALGMCLATGCVRGDLHVHLYARHTHEYRQASAPQAHVPTPIGTVILEIDE